MRHHIPALDGLRGLAVIAVVLLHAGFGWANGGFLGVDVFFVLSGFLITTLLLREWQATGTISLRAFYWRRIARLFPALAVLLLAVTVWSLAGSSSEWQSLRGVGASLVSVANWAIVLAPDHQIGKLQHTWSLAIEEQFYLLWPFVLVLLLRRGWGWQRLAALTVGGAIASAVWRAILWRLTLDPWRVYGGSDTRADGLLIGCALALLVLNLPSLSSRRVGYALLPVLGLAALGGVGVWWSAATPWEFWWYSRGGYAAVAVLSAAIVLLAATGSVPYLSALLSLRPLVWVGQRSYGIYLWHYPILTAFGSPKGLENGERVALIALSIGVAAASWALVEQPIQRWARSVSRERQAHHSTVASRQYTSPQRVQALSPNE